ncbi:MAG: HAMP domain-containing histidine kinase [Clostridia bacterium]|nr:HAMP domain-containing histidine kinase [Clostridia bacterium]
MHLLSDGNEGIQVSHIILFMAITSLVMGTIISIITSKMILSPLNMITSKINSLASGNFGTRVDFDEIVTRVPSFSELSSVFNKLSEELQNTEMLRSDFINNFSHEFKTPIVSISGFAKLLKKGNLTDEQRREYLDAIEEESLRLAYMATNVLNLTKIENQSILTDISSYNVSEQIRSCILLLEGKWSKKNLEFQLEIEEHSISACEELLKQVWINLIDNAIKFSNDGQFITISSQDKGQYLCFSITNYGIEIPKTKLDKIFNKFYQCDESHSTHGNGIGLSIVKKIVYLHNGEIKVVSENNSVSFHISLPKKPNGVK